MADGTSNADSLMVQLIGVLSNAVKDSQTRFMRMGGIWLRPMKRDKKCLRWQKILTGCWMGLIRPGKVFGNNPGCDCR